MKRFLLASIMTFLFFGNSMACLNGETYHLKNGSMLYSDGVAHIPRGHVFMFDDLENIVEEFDSTYYATKDLDYLSDKGLLLILLGRYDEAIKLYLKIEKIEPNRYSTASNIGTAYELIGQNENALKWIKKAVEINPKSHHNSEWIHVNILKAKIQGEQFYSTKFLLNTEFGNEPLPKSQMTQKELYYLSEALNYQLNERMTFVKPKEKIVAQLLFDMGNIAFLLGEYGHAQIIYNSAKEYGYTDLLIDQRIEQSEIQLNKKKKQESDDLQDQRVSQYITYGLVVFGVLFLTVLSLVIYKRRKKGKH